MTLVALLLLFGVMFLWFLQLERSDRTLTLVMIVWGLLIADSVLYPGGAVETGLFHPLVGGISFRPLDIVLPVAFAARLAAGGMPRRISAIELVWSAFLIWILTEAVIGTVNGNSLHYVSFESKLLVYLSAIVLTADVPLSRYMENDRLVRGIWFCGVLAFVLVITDQMGIRIHAQLPLLPLTDLGGIGTETGTILPAIGVLALALGVGTPDRHLRLLLPAAPLLISAFAADQRAALLATGISLIALVLILLVTHRRLYVTAAEASLATLAAIGCLLVPVVGAKTFGKSVDSPFESAVTAQFTGREPQLTNEYRLNQLRQASHLITERPVFGWGLGATYVFYDPGRRSFQESYQVHNITADLLFRTGAVGLFLFAAGIALSLHAGLRAWFRSADPGLAAVGLAVFAVILGLIGKGMVETIFENYRLGVVLGLLVGMSIMVAREEHAAP